MKKAILSSVFIFLCILTTAQVPEYFNYQVVVRDGASNNPLTNQDVSFKMSILKGSSSGESQYSELHGANTGVLGIVNLVIGSGTGKTGNITTIDWGADIYFLNVEIDKTGGSTYVEMGTTQLLSVPYALYAKKAGTATETDPVFTAHPSNGISGTDITNWNTAFGWSNHALAGYIPGSRTLTINGTAYDLTADRSWSVGTVTSVDLLMPAIFSVSGSPVTGSGTLSAELVSQSANLVFASPSGSAGAPLFRTLDATDIPDLDWSKITTGKPTTLADYGITDGVNTSGDQTIGGTKTFSNTIVASNGMNANSKSISDVADPASAQDAATKAYVDALKSQVQALENNLIASVNTYRIIDIEGNQYKIAKIGNQVWMAENLKTTKYNDGTSIPLVSDFTAWTNLTTPGYCWYSNNAANKDTYGALYNWYTVNTGILCPTGWHIPTDAEWTTMENYLIANGFNYDGTTTGNKIAKALASTSGWNSSSTAGAVGNTDYPEKRNATGFTALPGGDRFTTGTFGDLGKLGYWWTATEYSATSSWFRSLDYDGSYVWRGYNYKGFGFSVRCVRD